MAKIDTYIGLGSNLDEPQEQVRQAIEELKKIKTFDLIRCSSLYETPPMGPQNQSDYVNAVIKIQSDIAAIEILDKLQYLEQVHGRIKLEKWGARSLDLDILLYGQQEIDSTRLKIPHPGLYSRAFVLYPLLEIEPEMVLPNGVLLTKHISSMGKQDIVKLT
jgi:2-amino-4-hydroxy-6-hydroxymethyldihydropteridine diphosphokinase